MTKPRLSALFVATVIVVVANNISVDALTTAGASPSETNKAAAIPVPECTQVPASPFFR
jgi:hypothetical protein